MSIVNFAGHESSSIIGRSPLFGVSIKREFSVTIKLGCVPVAAYKVYCIATLLTTLHRHMRGIRHCDVRCAGSRTDIHLSEVHNQNRVLW